MSPQPDDPEFMAIAAEMAEALMPHVRLEMLLPDDESLEKTRAALSDAGIAVDAIGFAVDPQATLFLRDGAAFLVDDEGALAVLDLAWNQYGVPGWCERLYADDPDALAQCLTFVDASRDALDRSIARACGAAAVACPLFLENAAFEVNGRGVLLISEPLALERNPGRTRDEIERVLLDVPGITKVIWLAEGLAQDPLEMSTLDGPYVGMGADGHTDEFVRFADAHTILLASVDAQRAAEHPIDRIDRERMLHNRAILAAATDQDGRPFRIVDVPLPSVLERKVVLAPREDTTSLWNEALFPASEGRRAGDEVIHVASASYLNLVIANDLVLVPSFVEDGTPAAVQDEVRRTLEDAFAGRTIRFVHAAAFTWDGGGPHCATLSQPRARRGSRDAR
ncbi:MAG: agmatine deiminase family protein [Planctomycetes bacterium]|nr:agmatine deiminase family protein [Planctomycetota bacterium]